MPTIAKPALDEMAQAAARRGQVLLFSWRGWIYQHSKKRRRRYWSPRSGLLMVTPP